MAVQKIPYTTLCPAGKTCSYAPTEALNLAIAYGELLDERDYQLYKTVKIGSQTWMAQNLNYDYKAGKFVSFCYDDNPENCDKYGRLYRWSIAVDSAAVFSEDGKGCNDREMCYPPVQARGVCPQGWHLPSENEFRALVDYTGGVIYSGYNLKAATGWGKDGNGRDFYGFSATPSGSWLEPLNSDDGTFSGVGLGVSYWAYTEMTSIKVYTAGVNYSSDMTTVGDWEKGNAGSVRCILDYEEVESSSSSILDGSSSIEIVDPASVVLGTLTDARDDQTYKTVTIGGQTWMAENLNYDYNEGTAQSYCFWHHADSCAKYGRLYTWAAAMDSAALFSTSGKNCGFFETCASSMKKDGENVRGACPEGWHLPNKEEMDTLLASVGGVESAVQYLKSTSGWGQDHNGTDDYGFSVIPAGIRTFNDYFHELGWESYFWSSTEIDPYYAHTIAIWNTENEVFAKKEYKLFAYSVRCKKD